jgi:hypothetical protein
MKFEQFASLSKVDISRFEKDYWTMLDLNGAIISETIGFHFSIDDDDDKSMQETKDLIETFNPIVIWCGTEELKEKVDKLGYQSKLFSWFEDGGFIVVLKCPFIN